MACCDVSGSHRSVPKRPQNVGEILTATAQNQLVFHLYVATTELSNSIFCIPY